MTWSAAQPPIKNPVGRHYARHIDSGQHSRTIDIRPYWHNQKSETSKQHTTTATEQRAPYIIYLIRRYWCARTKHGIHQWWKPSENRHCSRSTWDLQDAKWILSMKSDCSIDVKGFRFFTMERLFYALQLLSLGDSLDNSLNTRGWIMWENA